MITPYDWQEGIGNRAQYIEGKLKQGSPVLAVSLDSGILIYTRRRQSRKIFEVYDRLAFSAIGQQSDVEALRNAAVEFAHQEGYNRSEQDVTIQRVVTALSAPVKKAFSDFSTSPMVARSLFAEVNETPSDDLFFVLDYDGDYSMMQGVAAVGGTHDAGERALGLLREVATTTEPREASTQLADIWRTVLQVDDEERTAEDLVPESLWLDRSNAREDRFRTLDVVP